MSKMSINTMLQTCRALTVGALTAGVLSVVSPLLTSCATEDGAAIISEGRLVLPNVPGQWTYVSLVQSRVVGTCALSDTLAQQQWAARTDWDLAICNGMLRTNGGASGKGQGGAAVAGTDYDATDAAQPAAYRQDRDTVAIW